MAEKSRSSRLFLQRAGIVATTPSPIPIYDKGTNPVHTRTVAAPLPLPEFLTGTESDPPPGGGATQPWPHALPEGA